MLNVLPGGWPAKRPSITRRLARAVDRLITGVQEWLETPDKPRAKAAAYIILVLAEAYLAVQLIAFFFR